MSEDIIKRIDPVLANREADIELNILATKGGGKFVDKALTRYNSEARLQFEGGSVPTADGTTFRAKGRKDRAVVPNFAGRILDKICQYMFSEKPNREGADEEFLGDVNLMGWSVNRFMGEVLKLRWSAGWCWLHVDAPSTSGLTIAEKQAASVRPYWSVLSPLSVPDWKYDEQGNLEWLVHHYEVIEKAGPLDPVNKYTIREVWERGVKTVFRIVEGRIVGSEQMPAPQDIPFRVFGEITDDPISFDDIRALQSCILDLESTLETALFQQVYPQLVLPAGVLDRIKADLPPGEGGNAVDLILGGSHPILETAEEEGITRYVMPPAAELQIIRTDISERKKALHETVGFAMKPDGRAAESAEAKAYDIMDIKKLLGEQSQEVEGAEEWLVETSTELDPSFAGYEPKYSKEFTVDSVEAEFERLIQAGDVADTPEFRRQLHKAAFNLALKLSSFSPDEAEQKAILDEIAAADLSGAGDLEGLLIGNDSENDSENESESEEGSND
jgi:hypothetical protein